MLENTKKRPKVYIHVYYFRLIVHLILYSYSTFIFSSSRTLKRAEVVAMAAAKKKLALSMKKTTAAALTLPSKRPCPEAKMTSDSPWLKKRVKKLAKKEEHEIHVISS